MFDQKLCNTVSTRRITFEKFFKIKPMKKIQENWRCIANCGACCNLTPEDRPDLEEYLTPQELEIYKTMLQEDGWCRNLDKETRKCLIYEERPNFCRVQADIFQEMYQVEEKDFNEFAIDCCRDQIAGVYGEKSPELVRYNKEIKQ